MKKSNNQQKICLKKFMNRLWEGTGDFFFFFCLGREQMVKATRYENEKWIFKFWRINFSFFQPLLIYLLREEVEIIFFFMNE